MGVIGGLIGGLLGSRLGKNSGNRGAATIAGVAGGAAIGAYIGHGIDARRCAVYKLSKQYQFDVAIAPVRTDLNSQTDASGALAEVQSAEDVKKAQSFQGAAGIAISIKDAGTQFATGSAVLAPKAQEYFQKIAEQWSYERQLQALPAQARQADRDDVEALRSKRILMVGHTDDTGSSELNAQLSEARARAVAEVFKSQGVLDAQLFFQGAGETLPVADNRTDEGRAQNRRVEIVDLSDEASFQAYLASRRPNLAFYRPAHEPLASSELSPAPREEPQDAATRGPAQPASRGKPRSAAPPSTPAQSVQPTRANAPPLIDFGGVPLVLGAAKTADIGALIPQRPTFSLIPTAYAADNTPPGATCAQDRPRVSHGVKSLRSLREISTTEYLPGMYGTSWVDNVNGHLVALTGVTVLRDGGQPASQPKVLVYKDYSPNAKAQPTFQAVAEINTYRGRDALLYRVFINGPVQCMDVVLPYGGSKEAKGSQLVYRRAGNPYVADFKPHLAS